MPSNYPSSLDVLSNPAPTEKLGLSASVHSAHHGTANDALEAIEAKVGTGASTASANTVLRGTGSGTTAFGPIVGADITNATIPATKLVAGSAMVLIAETVLGSAAAAITITSLPTTSKHLRLTWQARSATAGLSGVGIQLRIGFSGALVTTATYDFQNDISYGATLATAEQYGKTSWRIGPAPTAGIVANVAGYGAVDLFYYTASVFVVQMTAWAMAYLGGASYGVAQGLAWEKTSGLSRTSIGVIERVSLFADDAANLVTGSRLSVYGDPT